MKVSNPKCRFLLMVSALIVLAAFGQATQAVTQEWVALYDGGASDYPQDIALDSSGNVYVTGFSSIDGWTVTTVKYDSAGTQLWVQNYDYRPGTGLGDWANKIAVDSSGNVYVTGATLNGSNTDVLTMMYDTNGNFQWATTYDSATNGYDEGHDIAVNSTTGDVYITGRSDGNLIIIRYNSVGAQQFVSTYGGTFACGHGIAIDGSGNVCVTGTDGTQYITIKRNSTLNTELWSALYNGPDAVRDVAYDIALDSSGNAYVTGYSPGLGTGEDCVTIKYSSAAGAALWVKRYDNVGLTEGGDAIVVDSSGNAYVAGSTVASVLGADYLTIMYDTTGVQQWVKLYDGGSGDDLSRRIAIDTETPPNVYVTGESSSLFSLRDFATVMYDNAGNRQWVIRYNGPSNLNDYAQAIAVYDQNNIYVTGETTGDYATVKYSQEAGAQKIVKWEQPPDLTEQGIDVNDTMPYILADDFNCTTTGPITEITVWGSWINDYVQMPGAVKFRLSIHSDIPDDPYNPDDYSRPGDILWMKEFLPGQFTVEQEAINLEEGWMDPPLHYIPWADSICWKYTFTIDPNQAFMQMGKPNSPIVYWLDVQAEPEDAMAKFGWKTARTHWNDDAVWGMGMEPYPGPWNELIYPPSHPFYPESIDLAFRIVTEEQEEPEPEVKWLQKPDLSTNGLDVMASEPRILADDFLCTKTTLITDITVWGSWKYDFLPPGGPNDVGFTLSIYSDIPDPDPCDPTNWSIPGDVLWSMDIIPASISIEKDLIQEGWWDPQDPFGYISHGDTVCWKYTFKIDPNYAFCQQGEPNYPVVYWLGVQANPNDPTGQELFGWKSSINHWNDDAVWGDNMAWWKELRYPEYHELYGQSIDLAFAIDGNIPCTQTEDFGDAPDGVAALGYPTLLINNGARHIIDGITFMGALVDAEGNGQPTANADGDDLNPPLADDEDGVVIPVPLMAGQAAVITVTASVPGMLDAWIDYAADGSWAEAGDQIAASLPLVAGGNPVNIVVPVTATLGQTYARFRFSTGIAGALPPFGPAPDGEVEDYLVTIIDPNTKYLQRPDESENGIDIRFDRTDGILRTLADDFPCTTPGKITDVHLWCSWLNDIKGNVQTIHLSIHDDIPAATSPTGYSMPGTLLWQRDVTPADFNETLFYTLPVPQHEWWWDPYMYIVNPMGDTQIWRYDINIPYTQAFRQEGNETNPKVYWLDAWVTLSPTSPPEAEMGWKTSMDHWNDAAVYDLGGGNWINLLYPMGHPHGETNVDMAFAITTKPDCLKSTAAAYADWVIFGRPDCWCYQRHCHADYNGTGVGVGGAKKWVTGTDLIGFKAAYNKSNLLLPPGGICADFNHTGVPAAYSPIQKRVTGTDLIIFKNYYNKREDDPVFPNTVCPGADYNFWTN